MPSLEETPVEGHFKQAVLSSVLCSEAKAWRFKGLAQPLAFQIVFLVTDRWSLESEGLGPNPGSNTHS